MKHTVFSFALALTVAACGNDDAPRVPLGQQPQQQASAPTITGEARIALDSANNLFRAKAYERALAQYERTTQLAPREVAPLLGMMMVADATSNADLRTQTLARIRALDPVLADSTAVAGHSQMVDLHSRAAEGAPPAR